MPTTPLVQPCAPLSPEGRVADTLWLRPSDTSVQAYRGMRAKLRIIRPLLSAGPLVYTGPNGRDQAQRPTGDGSDNLAPYDEKKKSLP